MSILKVEGLTKLYKDVKALDNVSFEFEKGILSFLGPSGCGKTTLLRSIAGLEIPDAGLISIGDKVQTSIENGILIPPYSREIGFVFQNYALWPHMTVFKNVAFGLNIRKISAEETKRKVLAALELVGLGGREARYPSQLSGGQQQRVALARSLALEPRLILLDEPLSNLDAKLREEMRGELRKLIKKVGISALYVTHDQDEALSMSDLIAVMRNGRIEQVGTPWEIYFRPQTKFVADFVGVVNFLGATLLSASGRMAVIELCGRKLEIGLEKDWETGEKLTLVVRPESLVFLNSNDEENRVVFVGEIINSSFLGHLTRYWVQAGNQTLIVDDTGSGPDQSRKGMVTLALDTGKTHVLTEDVR